MEMLSEHYGGSLLPPQSGRSLEPELAHISLAARDRMMIPEHSHPWDECGAGLPFP